MLRRQIVTLTYPHIGNTGVNAEDVEADKVHAAGLIIRDLPLLASNFRSQQSLARLPARRKASSRSPASTRASSRASCATRARRTAASDRRGDDRRRQGARTGALVPGPGGHGPGQGRLDAGALRLDADRMAARQRLRRAGRRRSSTSSPSTTASSATSCACSPSAAATSPCCRRKRRRATRWRCKPGRHLPLQRPRRPGAVRLRDRRHARIDRARHPDLRHLPRPPDHRPGRRREDAEDEVRPPRREPSGARTSKRAA